MVGVITRRLFGINFCNFFLAIVGRLASGGFWRGLSDFFCHFEEDIFDCGTIHLIFSNTIHFEAINKLSGLSRISEAVNCLVIELLSSNTFIFWCWLAWQVVDVYSVARAQFVFQLDGCALCSQNAL